MKDADFENKVVDFLKNNLSVETYADLRHVGGEYGYVEKFVITKLRLKVGDEEITISKSEAIIPD
tara:strand:+ start:6509 stop:6703 length:195 start_codon:yes stop_codon:yes gene_type:complete